MASLLLRSLRRSTHLLRPSAAVIRPSTTIIRPQLPPPPPPPPSLRPFSTSARRRPRPLDIGAKARQIQNRRLWTYALTFSSLAAFVIIVLNQFQDSLVFYLTPTDALNKFAQDPKRKRFRLGGLVLEGSVVHPSSTSPEIEFVVTDLVTDILVRYEGSLPDLFREGHSCVVEGFLKPFEEGVGKGSRVSEKARGVECYFNATEVLAKHDEKYMPKEVAEALEKNKKMLKEREEEQKVAVA